MIAENRSGEKTSMLSLVVRTVFALLVMAVAFSIGFAFGGFLTSWTDSVEPLRRSVPALAIGVLLGLLRETIVLFDGVIRFSRDGDRLELWKPVVTVLVAGIALAMAVHLLELSSPGPETPSIIVWNGVQPPPQPTDVAQSPSERYAIFPVFFARDATGFEPSTGEFAGGTNVDSVEEIRVKNLVRALEKCGEGVRLSVQGYSSSSMSGNRVPDEVVRINLSASNARAASVFQLIRESRSSSSEIAVDLVEWQTIEEMEEARAFNDRADGEYVDEVGVLTRRADIMLVNPGECGVGGSL